MSHSVVVELDDASGGARVQEQRASAPAKTAGPNEDRQLGT